MYPRSLLIDRNEGAAVQLILKLADVLYYLLPKPLWKNVLRADLYHAGSIRVDPGYIFLSPLSWCPQFRRAIIPGSGLYSNVNLSFFVA